MKKEPTSPIRDKSILFQLCKSTAKEHGGKCLSEIFVTSTRNLKWQCKEGHQWKATWSNVRRGKWCPVCAIEKRASKRRSSIEQMQELAKTHNGKCLSKSYSHSHSKLEWECSSGHKFFSEPASVQQGTWCPYCYHQKLSKENLSLRLEKLEKMLKKKNGSLVKVDAEDPLFFFIKCEKNHIWRARSSNLFHHDSWCPECSGTAPYTISEIQKIAKAQDGKCHSKEYINSRAKLDFECKFGHQFKMNADALKADSWCPECAPAKKSIKSAQFWAQKKSGKCISAFFELPDFNKKIIKLECHKKHQWLMSLAKLRMGYWCPECITAKIT